MMCAKNVHFGSCSKLQRNQKILLLSEVGVGVTVEATDVTMFVTVTVLATQDCVSK